MANTTATDTADSSAELGQALVELMHAQTRHNLEILAALTSAVDWHRVFKLQGEFLRESLDRTAQLACRYLEATQAVLDVAADVARDQARKAA